MRKLITSIIIPGVILFAGITKNMQAQPFEGEKLFPEQIAPLLEGMGEHGFTISSEDELAAIYFNQAIALTYGFNHLEAGRSFKQVTLLDEQAAIAYWGQALVLGPNINAGMEPDAVLPAYQLIQKAKSLKEHASGLEADLIDALVVRYSQDETLSDRAELDRAYADAMRKVLAKYPDDPNVRTLLASALMNLHPWDYWYADGRPKPWTSEILDVLEGGLEKNPRHAGLIHYYIHAVEASKKPERAMAGADILGELVPGAGHLVHMPSHIYIRTGKYHKGVLANEQAVKVDNNYITQCRQQGIYPLAYVPHNRHFLWAVATLEGSSEKAIKAAEHMSKHIDKELMRAPGLSTLQHYWVTPMYAYVRFGKWDKIFNTPKPGDDLLYPLGVWHYARGIAFTAEGDFESANKELQALKKIGSRKDELQQITVWETNDAWHILKIAALALEGEYLARSGEVSKSLAPFRQAIELEENLNYNEPSDWHYPVRQSLGAVLLENGNAQEAERVYRADLENYPENGWSLFGLYKSLVAQGKTKEAEQVKQRFEKAWQWADFELKASRVL